MTKIHSPNFRRNHDVYVTQWYDKHVDTVMAGAKELAVNGLHAVRTAFTLPAAGYAHILQEVQELPLFVPGQEPLAPPRLNPVVLSVLKERPVMPDQVSPVELLRFGSAVLSVCRGATALRAHPEAISEIGSHTAILEIPESRQEATEATLRRPGAAVLLGKEQPTAIAMRWRKGEAGYGGGMDVSVRTRTAGERLGVIATTLDINSGSSAVPYVALGVQEVGDFVDDRKVFTPQLFESLGDAMWVAAQRQDSSS